LKESNRLASLYRVVGWQFDGLQDRLIFVSGRRRSPVTDMNTLSEVDVRRFLLDRYRGPIQAIGLNPDDLTDDFDFLLSGVIDSFGILEMISAIEEEFQIQLDLATLDAEDITRLGPLAQYIAKNPKRN
jgi:acyl carrier protein